MSDERFDQELRSVLLEDAPRDVPDDLRRRVAAVPNTHRVSTRLPRLAWWRPSPLGIASLATVAVLLAAGLWRFGPSSQPGVGVEPPASSTIVPHGSPVVVPSAPSTVAPSASAGPGACRSADLAGRILRWEGAAGSRIAEVQITNTGQTACFVRGTPGLELVDGNGRVLLDSAAAGPSGKPHVGSGDPSFELAPGGRLQTLVLASNYCGPAPSPPIDIAFTLPGDGGRFLAKPAAGVSSVDAVPPCLGPTGGHITMNGWRR